MFYKIRFLFCFLLLNFFGFLVGKVGILIVSLDNEGYYVFSLLIYFIEWIF